MHGDKQWPLQLIKFVWVCVEEGAKGKVAAACVSLAWTAAVSWVSFSCFLFFLVCVIMCKVEEKQLEAALSGDGGGTGRNQNTSGLFKLRLASPCPESSVGPRRRLRFLSPISSGERGSGQNSAEGAREEPGLCVKHLRRRRREFFCLLSTCFSFFPSKNSSAFVNILFFFGIFTPLSASCRFITDLATPACERRRRAWRLGLFCHCQSFCLGRWFRIRLSKNPNRNGWRGPSDLLLIQS